MEGPRIPDRDFPMEIAPGIHVLGNYYFNLFLVSGPDRTVLFETGISGVVDRVIKQIEGLGTPPDTIVVSHPHADHITGLPGLRERFPRAEILAASGAQEFVTHPKAGPALIEEDAFMSRRLTEEGMAPGRPSLTRIPDLTGHTPIKARVKLDLGGRALDLIPVGGHSPGNLIAWEARERILFCSDSLGFHFPGRGFWPLFFTGLDPYLDTIDLMERLAPRIICPAHQGPVREKDVAAGLVLARQAVQGFITRAAQDINDDDALARSLFEDSYRDEFTLYTRSNIDNCNRLLVRRARE